MTGWRIYEVYLLETLSIYTREKLKSYGSLAAYNSVVFRHVQDITSYNYNTEAIIALVS